METQTNTPPIPTGLNRPSVEEIAEFVAEIYKFKVTDSIEQFVEKCGGEIDYFGMGHGEPMDGTIIAKSFSDFKIWLSPLTHPLRNRFTIAHELGHLFLHLSGVKANDETAIMVATLSFHDHMSESEKKAEFEANWFAAAFLMPSKKFNEICEKYSVEVASSYFNVSLQSAKIRAKTLGIEG